MAETVATERKLRARGPIRVTVPAKVAYSPDAFKKSIAGLMERIGCPKCFSGADCTFLNERLFAVDIKGGIAEGPHPEPWRTGLAFDPSPQPWKVTAALAGPVRYDINQVFRAVDKVIDLIGPHPCISGFDISFQDVLNTVIINEKLEGQVFGPGF